MLRRRAARSALYTGEFWDKFEKGIYVDVVTGDPESPKWRALLV